MSDVFVSYKAEDRRRIKPLVDALQAEGFSVWWDEQIGGGSAWRRAIEAELDAASCVVVAWSKLSAGAEGTFVQDEAARAQQRHVYVPVLIDKVRPPLGFGETQALPLTGWRGDRSDPRYAAVRSAVQQLAAAPAGSAARPRDPPWLNRRAALIGGGAAVLVAAASGTWFAVQRGAAAASDSIAVLPFGNLSGDPSQAYFADGMAEELRSALARVPRLRVVARTSSEAVRNQDARSAAQKLGVANILSGSIRRSPALIRVSAQLIDGHTGLERWSEEFDQPVGDTLAIQTNIATKVTQALRLQLAGPGKAVLNLGGTDNLAAQDLFLKAKLNNDRDSPAALRASLGNADAAIELDPQYAQAYALKSDLLALFSAQNARTTSEMGALLKEAVVNAQKAITLAPDLAQGHSALGFALDFQMKFRDALHEMEKAVRLPGTDADVHARYAILLAECGRSNAAQQAAADAVSLDPLNPRTYQQQAITFYLGSRFPGAIAAARRALELAPTQTFVRGILANSLTMMGRNDEAAAEYAKMPEDHWQSLAGRAILAFRKHDIAGSDHLIERLRASWGDSANSQFAEIYAQRGDADRAIAYLQKPAGERDAGFVFIAHDPLLQPVRSDPRFQAVIRTFDFPT